MIAVHGDPPPSTRGPAQRQGIAKTLTPGMKPDSKIIRSADFRPEPSEGGTVRNGAKPDGDAMTRLRHNRKSGFG